MSSSGANITKGIHEESPATDAGINFMNYLEWRLAPGTYRLRILYCYKLNFIRTESVCLDFLSYCGHWN